MSQYRWTSVENITKTFKVSRGTIRKRLEEYPGIRTLRFGDIENGKFFILTEDIEKLNLYTRSKRKVHAFRRLQKENI
jgi:hypothetical protein